MQDFIASGLSKKQAAKKARAIILSANLDKLNNDKKPLLSEQTELLNPILYLMRRRLNLILGT